MYTFLEDILSRMLLFLLYQIFFSGRADHVEPDVTWNRQMSCGTDNQGPKVVSSENFLINPKKICKF